MDRDKASSCEDTQSMSGGLEMKVSKYACELARLVEKNRYLHPRDMIPKERADIRTLFNAVRMVPPDYPSF